ncbi:MAG: hypothetical protein CMF49_02865 [Legionellales bacterium]|nr:hypothetical protein [Legionellales bacterium]|tara:strand:+ start:175 stop:441 length:267 start_codon:yes stop_codon:yes gene_type:complete
MLTPVLIQIIFWFVVAYCLFVGIYDLARHMNIMLALEILILGPIAARIISEFLILFFTMNETLTDIRDIQNVKLEHISKSSQHNKEVL